MPGKEKVVSTRICGETSCNQILARFLLVKSSTKGLNVLYNPFRERTRNWSQWLWLGLSCFGMAATKSTMAVKMEGELL
jgi:hypothetical protein